MTVVNKVAAALVVAVGLLVALSLVGCGAVLLYQTAPATPVAPVDPAPCPGPGPCPLPGPKPRPKPWGPNPMATLLSMSQLIGERATTGGPVGPEGIEVACDLPLSLRLKNVGGRDGAGLCVFTSIMHAARYQNERRLKEFQKQMRSEPGGGYPEKVDRMVEKYGKGTTYVQYEGKNPEVLDAAIASGRMPSVTYGYGERYGSTIAHMVNLVHIDQRIACVLDNNFIGEQELEWMSRAEFLRRWQMGGGGWAVVLLNPAPAPIPMTAKEE